MIFVCFLVPLGIYCLILASWNRGRRAVLISGPWDFAGILFAVSGFLLVGGPAILTGLYEQWRMSWLLGQTRFLQELEAPWPWVFWLSAWALYYILICAGAVVVLRWQSKRTAIYNVQIQELEQALQDAGQQLELHLLSSGPRRVLLKPKGEAASFGYCLALRWEPFAMLRHISLYWEGDASELRHDVEIALAQALRAHPSGRRGPSAWFAALGMFFLVMSSLIFLSVVVIRALRILP